MLNWEIQDGVVIVTLAVYAFNLSLFTILLLLSFQKKKIFLPEDDNLYFLFTIDGFFFYEISFLCGPNFKNRVQFLSICLRKWKLAKEL